MKATYLSIALLMSSVFSSVVSAQEVKSFALKGNQFAKDVPVNLEVHFNAGGSNYCGLVVDWGDGQKSNVRIGDDNLKTSPIALSHTYANAGNYTVSGQGQLMIRGLKTAAACDGRPSPVQLLVVDVKEQQRQADAKALEAERNRALKEVEDRQRQLAERELELKRKELEAKEELLKKEEELRRRAAAAAPAPAPARVAPIAAPAQPPAQAAPSQSSGGVKGVKPSDAF